MAFARAIRFLVSEGDAVVAMDVAETLVGQFPDSQIEHIRAAVDTELQETRPSRVTIAILSSNSANQELCERLTAARAGVIVLGDHSLEGAQIITLRKPFSEDMLVGAIEDSLAML